MAAETPAITVLLPMYNGERFLVEQVDSILGQLDVTVRLIIVDDGSRDGSLRLARQLAAFDDRVTVLQNPENRGLIGTLDRLLSLVDTPYFSLADQDDVWDSHKLRTSVDFLLAARHQLVYSDVRIVDENGREQASSYLTSRGIRPIEGRDPVPFVFCNPAIGHTIVARREVAEAARPMPAELTYHEAWLVAVACTQGTVGFVPGGPLGGYRLHTSNVVGPSRGPVLARAGKSLVAPARLWRRERTRAAALRALASLDASIAGAAAALSSRGMSRLPAAFGYARFLVRRLSPAGGGAVLRELGAFLVTSCYCHCHGELVSSRPLRRRPRGRAGAEHA